MMREILLYILIAEVFNCYRKYELLRLLVNEATQRLPPT